MKKTFGTLIILILILTSQAVAQTEYQETEANGVKVQSLTHNVQDIQAAVEGEAKESPEDKSLKDIGCEENQQSGVSLWDNTVPATVKVQTHTTGVRQNSQK